MKVLFIGGALRSGTTLLERLVAAAGDAASVGEVSRIWDHGLMENHLCGCGKPFTECGFWREVTAAAGGNGWPDPEDALRLRLAVDRMKQLPRFLFPGLASARFERRVAAYTDVLGRLFGSIATVSERAVIVDSSKAPTHAHLLMRSPGVELYVVHMTRDSRGVAFSWRRKRRLPEIWWKEAYWPRFGPTRVAIRWVIVNLAFEHMASAGWRVLRVRYEDLVARPRACLERIFEFAGEKPASLDFLDTGRSAQLTPSHTVSGNPMRFDTGPVRLVADTEWRLQMRPAHRVAVTAMTYPLLRRYGYVS